MFEAFKSFITSKDAGMWVFLGGFVFLALIAFALVIRLWYKSKTTSVLTVPTRVIGKRIKVTGGGNMSVDEWHYITFQFEGKRQEFRVSSNRY